MNDTETPKSSLHQRFERYPEDENTFENLSHRIDFTSDRGSPERSLRQLFERYPSQDGNGSAPSCD